jgi:hypothetical protein
VPAKPAWFSRLDRIIEELEALPRPFVDRATVEFLFGVGRRRAQQIMAPCISDRVGTNGLAAKDLFIAYLRRVAGGDQGYYEMERRRKVAQIIGGLRKERIECPRLMIEAPREIVNQEFDDLPTGVRLDPGRITVEFGEPQEALAKLLSLAMAISNDFDRFDRITRHT